MAHFAEVVVNQTLRSSIASRLATPDVFRPSATGTFHYKVPAHLQDKLSVGQMVWIPFGSRRLQGVIVAFSDQSPVEQTKEIEGILDSEPALSERQLDLARWISDYYLCPLADAVALMLPPGTRQRLRTEIVVRGAPPWPNDLSETQAALLNYLLQRGSRRLLALRRKFGKTPLASDLARLQRLNLIERRSFLQEPRVQPLMGKFARLIASEREVEAALARLGSSTQASRLLQLLAHSTQPVWRLDDALEQAGSSRIAARALEKDGWIVLQDKRDLVLLEKSGRKLDEAIADLPAGAVAQHRVLEFLRDQAGAADLGVLRTEAQVSSAVVRTLEAKSLVTRVTEEARIHLSASREDALEHVVQMRGADRFRDILRVLRGSDGPVWLSWLYAETGCKLDDVRRLAEQGLVRIEEEEVERSPLKGRLFPKERPPALTRDQEAAWQPIREALASEPGSVFLLHGVTGSGKTEIYLRALQASLEAGKQAIVLVPEISLTPQTVQRFASRFPEQIAVLHSGLSLGERFDQWRAIRAGKYPVVIGTRSAVFAPVHELGLIVLDEEHEPSYKQERTPRYHAREAAVELARLTGAVVLLGSATPDLQSYFRARRGEYWLLELPKRILWNRQRLGEQRAAGKQTMLRFSGPVAYSDLPPVSVVDLRKELKEGNRSIFSRALQSALRETLDAKEQAILFLNRRGSATFVVCRDCGYVAECPRCELPLTYHGASARLVCHHCGRSEPAPLKCPSCGSARIRYFGLGTQKVVEAATELFPDAKILRWDRDVTRRKGAHDAVLQDFVDRKTDLLVGTQMVAKGLDLPRVTLVGVISADTSLYFPDYRACERTFQLLTQVAGRAGRSVLGGRVIVQTYAPSQWCIQAASRHDYQGFAERELAFRKEHAYPPFARMARLLYSDTSLRRCRQEGERMRAYLEDRVRRLGLPWASILGPAPCFFPRLRGRHRWQIIVRCADPYPLLANLAYDERWRVDIDPVEML